MVQSNTVTVTVTDPPITVTVTAEDVDGNRIRDMVPFAETTSGRYSGVTDANGQATFDVLDAENFTIHFEDTPTDSPVTRYEDNATDVSASFGDSVSKTVTLQTAENIGTTN